MKLIYKDKITALMAFLTINLIECKQILFSQFSEWVTINIDVSNS